MPPLYIVTQANAENLDVDVIGVFRTPQQAHQALVTDFLDSYSEEDDLDDGYDLAVDWEVWAMGGLCQWKIHEAYEVNNG